MRIKPSSRVLSALVGLIAIGLAQAECVTAQETPSAVDYSTLEVDLPDFVPYEAEYTSQSGRFFNQVRPFRMNGADKVGLLNIIAMPGGVIVDSRAIDRETLALDYMMTPYFAWGEEYVVAQFEGPRLDWQRVPIGGGETTRVIGESEHGAVVSDLGFSPALAALLPLPEGMRFWMPIAQPRADGSVDATQVTYEVVGMERLELDSGVACDCWILEQHMGESVTRFWVAREAPFVFRRHRDIGGPRDFVSDVLSFRTF